MYDKQSQVLQNAKVYTEDGPVKEQSIFQNIDMRFTDNNSFLSKLLAELENYAEKIYTSRNGQMPESSGPQVPKPVSVSITDHLSESVDDYGKMLNRLQTIVRHFEIVVG